MLRQHPQIWLPPIKELHYFNEYHSSEIDRKWRIRAVGKQWCDRRWRRYFSQARTALVGCHGSDLARWYRQYLFGERNDEWYLSLFSETPGGEKILTGEMTPAYQILSYAGIQHVNRLLPNAKILMILRDPIERTWSHARMELFARHQRDAGSLSVEEVLRFVSRPEVLSRGMYAESIRRWIEIVDHSRFGIFQYDRLNKQPTSFLQEIWDFLEVDSIASIHGINRRVFQGERHSIPPEVESYLSLAFKEDKQKLGDILGAEAPSWVISEQN